MRKAVSNLTGSAHEITEALRQELRRLEGARAPAGDVFPSSGCAALDRLLPGGGFARGTLVEWLAESPADGAGTLALLAARATLSEGSALVAFDLANSPHPDPLPGIPGRGSNQELGPLPKGERAERHGGRSPQREFYPPAAAALGIDLAHLIVVRAASERDELWALYQTLRSPGVGAVWAALEKLEWRWFRRLQLAAETGGAIGHFLRPASVRGRPTWSQLQLLVEPRRGTGSEGRRLRVELVRSRAAGGNWKPEASARGNGATGGVVELELDDRAGILREASPHHETHSFALAAELDPPQKKRRRNNRLAS